MHYIDDIKVASVMVSDEIMDVYEKLEYEKNRYTRIMAQILKQNLSDCYDEYCELYRDSLIRYDYICEVILHDVYKELTYILPTNVVRLEGIRSEGVFLIHYYPAKQG